MYLDPKYIAVTAAVCAFHEESDVVIHEQIVRQKPVAGRGTVSSILVVRVVEYVQRSAPGLRVVDVRQSRAPAAAQY